MRAPAWRASYLAAFLAFGCGEPTSTSPSLPMPSWSAPRIVASVPGGSVAVARTAGHGDSVLALWALNVAFDPSVYVSRLGADSAWQPPLRLGPSVSSQAQVGVDRAGRAVAAWLGPHPDPRSTGPWPCVWTASSDTAGNWTDAVPLACDVTRIHLAVGPAGDAAVVWSSPSDPQSSTSSRSDLWTARYRPGEGWSDLHALAVGLRTLFGEAVVFEVAVDETGVAAVAWDERPGPDASGRIHLATGRAGEQWSMSVLFGPAPGVRNPSVAFEAPGIPVVVWHGAARSVQWMRVTAGTNVPNTLNSDVGDSCIRITGSGRGASIVTSWRSEDPPGLWAASLQGGPPEELRGLQPRAIQFCPLAAMDEAGNAVVAWEEAPPGSSGEVWASVRRGPNGAWSQATPLSDQAAAPTATIANGVAYVVWRTRNLQDVGAVVESRRRVSF